MRFFPVWNATALGPASFTTLRAYGAFVVSGAIDASGTVAPVSLEAEAGGEVVLESPWVAGSSSGPPIVTEEGSGTPTPVKRVNITAVSPGVYSFASKVGGKYTISSG